MALEHGWNRLDGDEMRSFAVRWLASLQAASTDEEVGQAVVMLGFMAPADQQWEFLVAALDNSTCDEELLHIAAGPAECLLSRKGEDSITWFEERASLDRRFARMLTGVWRHMMSDDVWRRVQALQANVDDHL